jgi:signal transduction histidine kinase/CheY-like chemotaxis protein
MDAAGPALGGDPQAVRTALDGLPCGWLRLNLQGAILDANAETIRQTGRTHADLLGRPFDELLTLPSRVVYESYLLPLLRFSGDTAELALVLAGDATRPPLDVLFYSRRSPQDTVEVMLAPIRQRRRIEDELVRIKRAADQVPLMVFQLLTENGVPLQFPYASQSVRDLYQCTPEQAAMSADAVFGSLDADARASLREALGTAGAQARSSARCRVLYTLPAKADRGPRTHELVAVSRALGGGQVLWHGYVADATDRLRLEREAADRSAAEESARLRRAFLDRASHELRTPLNAILGFAQLLGKDAAGALQPEQRQALAVLEGAGQHLLSLVNRLLDLSRIETQGEPPPLAPLALQPELTGALQAMQAMAASHGITLHEASATPDCNVLAEPLSLRQLLTNLLSNAIKYNRRGGSVELGFSDSGTGTVWVWVADTGIGLDDTQRRQLFEPFNRLGAERTPTEGSGLGLVLARQLARSLGGDIEVDSTPGVGSRFRFGLAKAGAAAPSVLHPAARTAPPSPVEAGSPPPARGRVWYVEDNEVNALLMRAIATRRPGLELEVATHGAEAQALADRPTLRPPDLLLLDMHLPDTDGRELLAQLRRRPALVQVPAVLVTAAAEEARHTSDATDTQDFAECWIKPLDVDATLAAFDRLLAPPPTP